MSGRAVTRAVFPAEAPPLERPSSTHAGLGKGWDARSSCPSGSAHETKAGRRPHQVRHDRRDPGRSRWPFSTAIISAGAIRGSA
jgi:hypothetical protein